MSDILNMSDEEFLKQNGPDEAVESDSMTSHSGSEASDSQSGSDPQPESSGLEAVSDNVSAIEASQEAGNAGTNETQDDSTDSGSQAFAESAGSVSEDARENPPAAVKVEGVDKTSEDYENFYKQIMTPFKANGKMVELRTPAEAIQLMQMGANYTRKMQELVPHRKVLLMLENNGLLDEGKLSFLIDVEKKDPEAIKKLIKEAGIDPLDIDTASEPAYREGNHRVSDEEATFRAKLDDLKSNPSGLETLQIINTGWDHASKEVLWKSPEILTIIHEQKESGIYDRITTEVNRQKTLGALSPETPFLQAYKLVGDQMVAANAFADLAVHSGSSPSLSHGQAGSGYRQAAPVAQRVAAPKPVVANNDRANAASPTRASAQKAKDFINPLSMSDDDFLKQMQNRV